MVNVALLLLKWFLLGLLYIFLIIALFVVYKDLKEPRKAPAENTGAKISSRLVVLESPDKKMVQTFFVDGQAIIGRTADCDVILSDVSVSHKHARIFKSSRGFNLEDLGSKNGTFLNDRKISRPSPLRPGDLIKVGKTTFEFVE